MPIGDLNRGPKKREKSLDWKTVTAEKIGNLKKELPGRQGRVKKRETSLMFMSQKCAMQSTMLFR